MLRILSCGISRRDAETEKVLRASSRQHVLGSLEQCPRSLRPGILKLSSIQKPGELTEQEQELFDGVGLGWVGLLESRAHVFITIRLYCLRGSIVNLGQHISSVLLNVFDC